MSQTNYCPMCGNENAGGARFCSQCGTTLPQKPAVCSNCGNELAANAAFCSTCGQPVAATTPPSKPSAPVQPEPEPVAPVNYEHVTVEQLQNMAPGDHMILRGEELTMDQNGMLGYHKDGTKYVEATSFFHAQQTERNARQAAQPKQPDPVVEEVQPLWDPLAEDPVIVQPPIVEDPVIIDPAPVQHQQQVPYGYPPQNNGFAPPGTNVDPMQNQAPPTWGQQPFQQNAPQAPMQGVGFVAAPPPGYATWQQPVYAPPQQPQYADPVAPVIEDEDDEDEAVDPLSFLAERNGRAPKKKTKEDANDNSELAVFQRTVNQDGYYSDRHPLDEDEFFDGRRRIQWIPLLLGVGGILLFLGVALGINGML